MVRHLGAFVLALFALPALAQDAQPTGKRDLLIVIDCSGSMMGQTTEGEVKLEAAKRVLGKLIDALPDDLNVGLLAYGHRVPACDPGTCTDIELVVPVVATDKKRLSDKVKALQGKGRTPLAASLTKAAEVLKALGTDREKSLVVVTDGLETCGGDPKAAAAEDKGKPWRLRIARFPLATEVLAPWIDNPRQEVQSGDFYIFLSGTKGSGNFGTEGIEANALKADGSWLAPLKWGMKVEAKQEVEVAMNVGFRFVATQAKHEMEDEVRVVDEKLGVEVLRFSAASLGRYEWDEPAVVALLPGTYTMEWRRREGKTWFGIAKGYVLEANKRVDVKF